MSNEDKESSDDEYSKKSSVKNNMKINPTNSPISDVNIGSPILRINPIIEDNIGPKNSVSLGTPSPIPNVLLKSFQPILKQSNSSESGEQFKDIQSLLLKYRKESKLLAEIHMLASEFCRTKNQQCTLAALMVALVCSVVDPILQKYADEIQKIFTTVSFAFIGGLNVIFHFLAYQQREEKHKQARDNYLQIVDNIEVALAYSHEEGAEKTYDFTKVLTEVRQIKTSIAKNAPPIPPHISHKYECILAPSLLKYEIKTEKEEQKKDDSQE